MTDATPPRNQDLADAVNDIMDFALDRLAEAGFPIDFYIIAHDGTLAEAAGNVSDFDAMADAFSDTVSRWFEQGRCSEEPDDGPFFTATFDPAKVRPS